MNGRRSIAGLCMLCALAFSAFSAQSAGAASKGTETFTCKNIGDPEGTFAGPHCIGHDVNGDWAHVLIGNNTKTTTTKENTNETGEKIPFLLKATIAGVSTEIEATTVTGVGSMENKQAASGEHYSHELDTLTFTGVTVKGPAGKGCKVYKDEGGTKGKEAEFATNELTTTTEGQGLAETVMPAAGETVATLFIEGCEGALKTLNKTWTITGGFKGTPEGGTMGFTHAGTTAQETLFFGGAKAGINGSLTRKGKHPGVEKDEYRALVRTNVETP